MSVSAKQGAEGSGTCPEGFPEEPTRLCLEGFDCNPQNIPRKPTSMNQESCLAIRPHTFIRGQAGVDCRFEETQVLLKAYLMNNRLATLFIEHGRTLLDGNACSAKIDIANDAVDSSHRSIGG
jgi:hypothetical protein